MDDENTSIDTAKSIISDVLISESCIENLISKFDHYKMPTSEKKCDQPQPSSDLKPDQHMCQDKEPVDQISISSIKVVEDYPRNSSQDSTKSTLAPPLSQQSSSGFLLSLENAMKWDFLGSDKRIKKPLNYQKTVNNVSEPSVMKQIKVIHNYLNFCLKNSKVINNADKILLTNTKQLLFSLKQRHAVLCDSLKADFNQQIPSDKSRQVLKRRVNLLLKQQHKLLLLFQEHNIITKKIKMLNSDQCKQLEMALKQCSLPSSNLLDDPSLVQSKGEKISNNILSTSDDTQSESLSTVYSIGSLAGSQKTKSKGTNDCDCLSLSQIQEPISESFKIPNKGIKPLINNFHYDSQVFDSESNQTCRYNGPSQTLLLNNESDISCDGITKNSTSMSNDINLSAKQLTDYQQFTAIPIKTAADFTKANSHTQPSFDNSFSSEVTACQEVQNLEATSQVSQDVPVHSRNDPICTSINVWTVNAKKAESLTLCQMEESQNQISDVSKNDSINENNLDTGSNMAEDNLDDASSQITIFLTHLTLIEDEELIPLYSMLPSYQNTDPFGSIIFPKFLWDGFHKWP